MHRNGFTFIQDTDHWLSPSIVQALNLAGGETVTYVSAPDRNKPGQVKATKVSKV